ncbi:MAG: hypothetical protein SF066_17860 [Thermoanaerobaculia bacterium]|nr:hypothetical protein [Thermoanaerobaculia bacterium]
MVIGWVAIAGFLLFSGIGAVAAILHLIARKLWRRGSWPIFAVIACLVAASIAGVGFLVFQGADSRGAPTGDDYSNAILGALIIAISPGLGLVCGLLALLRVQRGKAS